MSTALTIRRFRWPDLEQWSLLFDVARGVDGPPDVEYARRFLSQPLCDPEHNCYVVESGGSLIGFALVAPELPIGRAVIRGGVSPSHRGAGVGRCLLARSVRRAARLRVQRLHVQVGEHNREGRRLLETAGFQPVRRYWTLLREQARVPPIALPRGFSFRSFRAGEDEPLMAELQNATFAGSWGFCPNTSEQVAARVGLRPWGPEGIILLFHGSTPAGYNWTTRLAPEAGALGRIEMTGVHPAYRRRRLGRAVVLAGIDYLARQRVAGVELEVDASNAPARDLYLSLGFRRVARTLWYEKRLSASA